MQTTTIRLTNVQKTGPFTKEFKQKDGSSRDSTYFILKLEGEGKTFTKFDTSEDVEQSIGDLVNIAFEAKTNGKYTNNLIKKIETLEDDGQSAASTDIKTTQKAILSTASKATLTASGKGTTAIVTKDTSMEVSGLLQAIIHHYGLTKDTEGQLRSALQLKRKVASELEQTGSV